jgi:hypothetical protein
MGVVIWQLMTGKSLFLAPNDAQIVYRVLEAPIPSPSEVLQVESPLESVVMWALQRPIGNRPSTALEMALAIEHSVAPATSRVVAEWMQSFAGDVLAERAAALQRAEAFHLEPLSMVSSSQLFRNQATPPPLSSSRARALAAPAAPQQPPPLPVARKRPAQPKMWWWVTPLSAFLLLGTSFWVYGVRSRAAVEAPLPSAVEVLPIREVPPPVALEPPPVMEDKADAVLQPNSPVEAPVEQPIVSPPARPPTTPARPRPRMPSKKAQCNPPFTIGPAPDYIRIPKLECLE